MNIIITVIGIALLVFIAIAFFQIFIYLLPVFIIIWAIWALYRAFFPKRTMNQGSNQTRNNSTYTSNPRQGTERKDVIDVDFEIVDDE